MATRVDARKIERRAQTSMSVNVGDIALVEPQGVGERFKTGFVGWEAGRCVILRLPSKLELRDHLYSGKLVIVRYLSCTGEVCGFECAIQGLSYKPQPLLFLDYPDFVEVFSLRKENRVDCFLPASLVIGEERLGGHILNLSNGGCRIGLPHEAVEQLGIVPDTEMECEFQILGRHNGPEKLKGAIRTVTVDKGKAFLGMQFQDVPDSLQEQIREYVVEVNTYLGDACPTSL